MWAEKSLADLDSSKMLANEQRQYLMLFMWNTAVICSANHLVNESDTCRNQNTRQARTCKGISSDRVDGPTGINKQLIYLDDVRESKAE
jgi:hypothetical protein